MTKLEMKQVNLYSVNTTAFFNKEEREIKKALYELDKLNNAIRKVNKKLKECEGKKPIELKNEKKQLLTDKKAIFKEYNVNNKNELKQLLKSTISKFEGVRKLDESVLIEKNEISLFESSFTRAIGIEPNSYTKDIFIIEVYYQTIMKQIIENGFRFGGREYEFIFASSGQIRNKKIVCIAKDVHEQAVNRLTAGLTDDKINKISTNKLIAYKALTNSASLPFEQVTGVKFNIDEMIIVDDFEHIIKDVEVDYIDSNYKITRKKMDIVNPVTDGSGMYLACDKLNKSMQIRMPWVKGLISPFPFDKFLDSYDGASPIIKDVWGKTWNIKEDGIRYILTKSQFKMAKFFDSWQEYKDNFKEYECEMAICKVERDEHPDRILNYQMIQSLFNMNEIELKQLLSHSENLINNATSSIENVLDFIGVKETGKNRRPILEAISLNNNVLSDPYSKRIVKDTKEVMINNTKAGKILLENTKRAYLIPDLYAFCEHLFTTNTPKGLLQANEVSCDLYQDGIELDTLRSPHLYIEHAIRTNKVNDEISKWFTTTGLYTSINDNISKILMFDVDGDEVDIVSNPLFIDIAKRQIKELDVVPLEYELKTGEALPITPQNTYKALEAAFSKNIGDVSNAITRLYNKDEISKEDIENIKKLCYLNNQWIDYAKTLWEAKMPKEFEVTYNKLKNTPLPYFFKFAKNKKNVAAINGSVVNRIGELFKTQNLYFKKLGVDNTYFEHLLHNKKAIEDKSITKVYSELVANRGLILKEQIKDEKSKYTQALAVKKFKEDMLKVESDVFKLVDSLLIYTRDREGKSFIWDAFGDVILINLKKSLGLTVKEKVCKCSVVFEATSNRQQYCLACSEENKRKKAAERKAKQRANKKNIA